MNLSDIFNRGPKPLASAKKKEEPQQPGPSNLAAAMTKKAKPGEFKVKWPKARPQEPKDYKPILTQEELEIYLRRCQDLKVASFDWETAADERTRKAWQEYLLDHQAKVAHLTQEAEAAKAADDGTEKGLRAKITALEKEYKNERKAYLRAPLDPHKSEICTVSLSAAAHESRVIPISHKVGRNFEPDLSREEARALVMKLLDRYLFRKTSVIKIAVNLSFETKFAAKYKKYILGRVADPLMMWVRCLQVLAPHKLIDPKKPYTGWGLKPTTQKIFGVNMQDFESLLERYGVEFFDEIDASQGDGLSYSAEDADYGLQHYEYWDEVAQQVLLPDDCPNKNYSEWLHNVEMPFTRVVGLMEYHGMMWDNQRAQERREEAAVAKQEASDRIVAIAKEHFDLDIKPGKSGKTGDVKHLIFEKMGLPVAKLTDAKQASLDEEAIIDMKFMLENKLRDLNEEKYLAETLPDNWQEIDPEEDKTLSKNERMAIRIAQRPEHPYKAQALEVLDLLKTIQKYSTLLSAHVDGREKHQNEVTGRIHASYGPWTDTARLMSEKPNGQNVPRTENDNMGVRGMYIPGIGKIFFFIDFSGFELRILAWKADDGVMIELFNTGGDMHRRTASVLAEKPEEEVVKQERTDAKPANFGITYGGTEHALQKTYKTDYGVRRTLEFCAKVVQAVKTAYQGIPKFQRVIAMDAREKGWVSTALGYIRLLPNIASPVKSMREADERRAANTPIQGTASDFMKVAQNGVYEETGRGTNLMFDAEEMGVDVLDLAAERGEAPPILAHGVTDLVAQIHDEMIFEMTDDPAIVEKAGAWVKAYMEREPLPGFPVKIEAEASVGYRWNEKTSLEEWITERRK